MPNSSDTLKCKDCGVHKLKEPHLWVSTVISEKGYRECLSCRAKKDESSRQRRHRFNSQSEIDKYFITNFKNYGQRYFVWAIDEYGAEISIIYNAQTNTNPERISTALMPLNLIDLQISNVGADEYAELKDIVYRVYLRRVDKSSEILEPIRNGFLECKKLLKLSESESNVLDLSKK